MNNLKKINKNLYKLENSIKLNFNKVLIPFNISKLYHKYNITIEINNNNQESLNVLEINKYKDLENITNLLKIIDENINLDDLTFYSNITNKNYKNNNLDLLRLSIKTSKNGFITKYYDIQNNEKSIFDIKPQKYYKCEIECNYLWITNNKYGLVLNLNYVKDVE